MLFSLFFLFASAANGQSKLKDIPSPEVQQQLEMFQLAEGFEIELFAAEPMVVKPIQMNWDAEGRLWVVSSTVYPHLKPGEEPNDKIYVLEDSNGDGKADKSTVFADGLITPTGILPGDGGVYVANSTELLHFKDTNGDGKADHKQVMLSGFGTGDTHHLIHTFRWGPDGLMYFNQSIYIYSHVETPYGTKRLHGGGVWQFNPQTLELNVFARGLINPWGLQFDRWGSMFITDGAGNEGINYSFRDATFTSAPGIEKRIRGLNPGQPKHSGLDIISGGHFPKNWSGRLVTNDFRANRINTFTLQEQGSGFVSTQSEDLLWTDHIAFRPVDILEGPDGALYVADWYNPIIQHGEVDFHDPRRDQQHGRIWRISAKGRIKSPFSYLQDSEIESLLEALKAKEYMTRIQAKQLLKKKDPERVHQALEKWVNNLNPSHPDYDHYLIEALWTFELIGKPNLEILTKGCTLNQGRARAATFRLLGNGKWDWEEVKELLVLGVKDSHPQARKEAVISLGKFENAEAAKIALESLESGTDEFKDFALWHTLRELEPFWLPKVLENPNYFSNNEKTAFAMKEIRDPRGAGILLSLLKEGRVPEVFGPQARSTIARISDVKNLNRIWQIAQEEPSSAKDWVTVLLNAASNRGVRPNENLLNIQRFFQHEEPSVGNMAIELAGYWQLSSLNQELMNLVIDGDEDQMKMAIQSIGRLEDPKSNTLIQLLSGEKYPRSIRVQATALMAQNDRVKAAKLAQELLNASPNEEDAHVLFAAMMRNDEIIATFTSSLMEAGIPSEMAKIGRQAMGRYVPWHRQGDRDVVNLKKALEASGGILPPERMPQKLNEQQLTALVQEVRTGADAISGEAVYRRKSLICQSCHAIGGAGGQLGPDLSSLGTSSPIDEIILSLLEPAESIKEGYELQKITKQDGGVVMGYLVKDGADELILRNATGQEESISKAQVSNHDNVPGSLMPPGLTSSLERQEFIDLVGFLSKLGKPGEFRVPNQRFIRKWGTVSSLPKEIGQKEDLAQNSGNLSIQPIYSMVSGELPISEIPEFNLAGSPYKIVQFELEVLDKGTVQLHLNTNKGVLLLKSKGWENVQDRKVNVALNAGIQKIKLLLNMDEFVENSLRVEVIEEENATPTRLVMGS